MADQPDGKRKPPISVADAVDQVGAAGSVAGLAKVAALDFLGEHAAAASNRLNREVGRLAARLGPDAPEVKAAAELKDRHAAFASALAAEQKRAAISMPATDPRAGVVYGRILQPDGRPAANLAVEARSNDRVLATGKSDDQGRFELKLPISADTTVSLRASNPDTTDLVAEAPSVSVGLGGRTYRELVLAPKKPPVDTPPPPATMPNLVGINESRARAVLERLGITRITRKDVESDTPAGQIVKQSPEAGRPIDRDTAVDLAVSQGALVAVPKLGGMSLADATVTLNRVGLVVGRIQGDQTGRISDQKPAAEQKVRAGTAVDLTFKAG